MRSARFLCLPLAAAALHAPLLCKRHTQTHVRMCAPPEPPRDDDAPSPPSFSDEYDAGLAFGKKIKNRFVQPRIDDPGLPYADSLVCVCGALFVAALGLVGLIPRPSWLFPLLPPGVEPM